PARLPGRHCRRAGRSGSPPPPALPPRAAGVHHRRSAGAPRAPAAATARDALRRTAAGGGEPLRHQPSPARARLLTPDQPDGRRAAEHRLVSDVMLCVERTEARVMKIFITGGNGLLGHHLVPALQERGDTVGVLALPGEDTTWLTKP